MAGFDNNIQIDYNEKRDILALRSATLVPENKDEVSLLLQIDYNMMKPEQLLFENVNEWLEEAHSIINNTFDLIHKHCN